MNNNHLPVIPPRYYNKELEEMIDQKDKRLKEQAAKNARHLAELNVPPLSKGTLSSFISEYKAGYEEIIAAVHHFLETGSHLIKGKTEYDHARKNEKELEAEISRKIELNNNDKHDMEGYNPRAIALRKFRSYLAVGIFFIVETILNTGAFQIFGDSLLFALIISAGISAVVFALAHIAPLIYKECTTRMQRILTVVVALLIATAIFTVTTIVRADYFRNEGIHTNASVFIVYNLAIFIVSAVLSYFLFPSWKEIKEDRRKARIYLKIQKRKADIIRLQKELKKVETEKVMRGHFRLGMPYYTSHLVKRINKKYKECVEKFKSTNILYRTDRKVPDCFSDEIPELEIDSDITDIETPKNDNDE